MNDTKRISFFFVSMKSNTIHIHRYHIIKSSFFVLSVHIHSLCSSVHTISNFSLLGTFATAYTHLLAQPIYFSRSYVLFPTRKGTINSVATRLVFSPLLLSRSFSFVTHMLENASRFYVKVGVDSYSDRCSLNVL